MGWDLWTCIHGIQEGLDSHSCEKCQEFARSLGFDFSNRQTYIFTKEWFELDKNKKLMKEKGVQCEK